MDPFASPGGQPDGDPFAAPEAIASEFPKIDAMRGRLVMVRPHKLEEGLKSAEFDNLYDRMTSDVYVIDGGPVKNEAGQPFEGTVFTAMYISQSRLIQQVAPKIGTGVMALGRLDTYKPGQPAKKGNPWGLADPTEADKAAARAYIAAGYRQAGEPAFGSAPAPQPAPVQQAPVPQGWGGPPVPQAAPVPPQQGGWGQAVQPAAGANPFG